MRTRPWAHAAVVVALLAGAASSVAAQGWIEPPRVGGGALVRLGTVVTARIAGRVARVEVEEQFQNRGKLLAEGDYYYPLPGEASFSDLSLWQGDRELKGETMDAQRARSIYEEIVRRRRDPALVELAGHGLLRARVFPIAPGETRRVTLRYTQLLTRAGDALVFRYAAGRPGVAAAEWRWTPPTPRPPRPLPMPPRRLPMPPRPLPMPPVPLPRPAPDEQPTQLPPAPAFGEGPIRLTLLVANGDAFGKPYSPTHELRSERNDGVLTVTAPRDLRGDFAVFLPLVRPVAGLSVAAYRTPGEDGYAMITLSPGRASGPSVPRDLTLALDVSGSMSGDKIEQARRALLSLLGSLSPADRFRLITFNSSVDRYRADWTPATAPELERARRWVAALQASGSTDIAGALAEAFRATSPANRLPVVVFVTDGLPTVGEQDPDVIADKAEHDRGRARVFAFGVGYDVNARLLDQLSAAARGTTAYVEPGEDLERPLAQLAAKIRYPVLTDLRLVTAPVELRELYPAALPDVFAGEELVLFARYRGAGSGELGFEGRRQGVGEHVAAAVAFPAESRAHDYIPRLWASRRIGALTRELRLHGRNEEIEREVRDLGLRYGILTDFTSYLVQEPGDVAVAPSAPSFLVSGKAAVLSAEAARARRESSSLAAMQAADAAVLGATASPRAASPARVVAGRRFLQKDGIWTDANGRLRVVAVEPFSSAYFQLLEALPELRLWCAAFERVEVGGSRVALRFAPGGTRELARPEIDRLVREFRRS